MLGSRAKKVLRSAPRARFAGGERSAGTYRATLRYREGDPRAIAGRKKRGTANEIPAAARSHARVAEINDVETVQKIGAGQSDSLCAGTLAGAYGVRKRRPRRDG